MQFIHLLAAAIWIGGAIFMNFVFAPVMKNFQFAEKGELASKISGRYSIFGWSSVAALLISGFYKLPPGILGNFSGHYGAVVNVKIVLITVMITLGLYLTLYLGSKMKRLVADMGADPSPEVMKLQKVMPLISMTITILGVVVLFLIASI